MTVTDTTPLPDSLRTHEVADGWDMPAFRSMAQCPNCSGEGTYEVRDGVGYGVSSDPGTAYPLYSTVECEYCEGGALPVMRCPMCLLPHDDDDLQAAYSDVSEAYRHCECGEDQRDAYAHRVARVMRHLRALTTGQPGLASALGTDCHVAADLHRVDPGMALHLADAHGYTQWPDQEAPTGVRAWPSYFACRIALDHTRAQLLLFTDHYTTDHRKATARDNALRDHAWYADRVDLVTYSRK